MGVRLLDPDGVERRFPTADDARYQLGPDWRDTCTVLDESDDPQWKAVTSLHPRPDGREPYPGAW